MIDALRTIVFIHGVQWETDSELEGYSIPLQRAIKRQAPSTRFRFREIHWSDLVESREREIMQAGKLIDLLDGRFTDLTDIIQLLLQHIFKRQGIQYLSDKNTVMTTQLTELIKGSGQSFKEKAFSAVMDVIIYESGIGPYQQRIRSLVLIDAARGYSSYIFENNVRRYS